jgi:glutathione synthase
MKIAFLMDPLESIDPTDETTSYLMYECNHRGHDLYFLEPHDLYIKSNTIRARMKHITVEGDQQLLDYWKAIIQCVNTEERLFEDVTELDVLFLRKDPPINFKTIDFLQLAKDDVFIINDIQGQVDASSKLYNLNFPEIIPETHISRDPQRIRRIIDEFGGDMVMKPTAGYKGEGVIKVSTRDPENLDSLINYYVNLSKPYEERNSVIIQEYLHEEGKGDVRILLLDGEILGAMRRIPRDGEFRANIHAGGRAEKHEVTEREQGICERLKAKLIADGLFFVGIDLIAGKLVEINCISPGGIPRINRLNGDKLESKVIDFIEAKVDERGSK